MTNTTGDEITGAAQTPVAQTATTQEPVVQPTETLVASTEAQTPVATETPVASTTPSELPVDTSTRTKEQFSKLTESNNKLFNANRLLQQELLKRQASEQSFAPIQQAQPIQQPTVEQFIEVDPNTGEQVVNVPKLTAAVESATTRASQAEQAVKSYIQRQEDEEVQKQTVEALSAYPELNPQGDKFDVNFHNMTRSLIYDSLIHPTDYNGRALTFKEAADKLRGSLGKEKMAQQPAIQPTPAELKAQKEADKTAQQNLEKKEQASLGTAGNQQPAINPAPNDELEFLRSRTRHGGQAGLEALAKRLTNVDHTGTPTSSGE